MTTNRTPVASRASSQEPELPTMMDHLQELKGRFFWIAVYFVVASGVAYPQFPAIVNVLTAPLGKQHLYYMTPAGGLSFILKVCMYVGIIAILPVIIYHLYKFVTPVMKKNSARQVAIYTVMSTLLAVAGIVFAYMVSLPAAVQFLTSISFDQISSMITIDSYMSFVIAYIVAGALLFQLPLVMLIVNSITPLKPMKLMSYQRHMIVGSFIAAAIISPTPDVVNQTLLAAPMIVMYQVGIVTIWIRNRKRNRKGTDAYQPVASPARVQTARREIPMAPLVTAASSSSVRATSAITPRKVSVSGISSPVIAAVAPKPVVAAPVPNARPLPRRSIDGVRYSRPVVARPAPSLPQRQMVSATHTQVVGRSSAFRGRSIDGFMIPSI